MLKKLLFISVLFIIFTTKTFAGTGAAGITTGFTVPENTSEGRVREYTYNINNPPESVYVLINNDLYIPGNNSVGDILEIANIHTGKKFVFDSQCSSLKLPPLNIRKLLDPSVYEREGRQLLSFKFINKCPNSKTIDRMYLVFKTDSADIEPFLSTMVDTDYIPPTSTPVPTPTISPTPTPPVGGIDLTIPLLKQGIAPFNNSDPMWEGDEFDHADAGQFTCGKTMAQCGCATTSIAMVLKYYGINKLPDGTELTPGTLNTWMKNKNGYNRNLGVIWPIVSTLSKQAKAQNPNFTYDALEYDTNRAYSAATVEKDLQNGLPNILEVRAPGMHFVVATGKAGNSFTINDPLLNRTSLAAYNNSAVAVRRYVPSNTDLSYLTYVADENVEITVRDSNGNIVGESYVEYSPAQLTEEPYITESSAIKVYYFAKPESGKYKVELSSADNTNFQLDEYIITEEGDVKTETYTGDLNADSVKEFNLTYDKSSLENTVTEPVITFDILKSDLERLYETGQIKNSFIFKTLILQVNFAERASLAERQPFGNKLAIVTLRAFQFGLKKYQGKLLTEEAYQILYKDTELLIKSLQEFC